MEPLLLSKSRLNCYMFCPEKYRLTYVEKVPVKATPAMVEGSCLHAIVENALLYKGIRNIAQAASDEFWNKTPLESVEYASKDDYLAAQEKTLKEAESFMPLIGDLDCFDMETWLESPLTHPITGEVDDSIMIRGYTDLLATTKTGGMRVIDIKTSKVSPNLQQADRSLDLSIYGYLAACTYGFHCQFPVSLLYLVRTKTPKVVWLDSLRGENDFLRTYEMIVQVAKAIKHELFWKNVSSNNCSWCQYSEHCFAVPMAA